MIQNRVLSNAEYKRLKKFKLPINVEDHVREAWQERPEQKNDNWLVLHLDYFILPIIIALFLISDSSKSWSKLDNVAMLLTWLLIIIASVITFCAYKMDMIGDVDSSPLDLRQLRIWGASQFSKNYGVFSSIVFVSTLAYCGHIFTAVVYFLCFLFSFSFVIC